MAERCHRNPLSPPRSSPPPHMEPAHLSEVALSNQASSSHNLESSDQEGSFVGLGTFQEMTPPRGPTSTILNHLPLDCGFRILEFLPLRNLSKISRVFKDLRASAEYILYRDINWEWCGNPYKDLPFLRVIKLLRTFHERPDFTTLVSHVSSLAYQKTSDEVCDLWEDVVLKSVWKSYTSIRL